MVMAVGMLLGGCAAEPLLGPAAAVQIGTTAVLGRGPVEAAYSLATGRDCSLANWAAEQRFCRQEEAPAAPRYCTRSLGVVDCWTVVDPYGPQAGVADTPRPPALQDRRWVDFRRPEPPAVVAAPPRGAGEQ
jgi:hypothetical protein